VSRRATGTRAGLLIVVLVGLVAWSNVPALAALPTTSNPTLHLDRTIRTTPFVGSSVSMKDGEGSAYVSGLRMTTGGPCTRSTRRTAP